MLFPHSRFRSSFRGNGQILPTIARRNFLPSDDILRRHERSSLLTSLQIHSGKTSQVQRLAGRIERMIYTDCQTNGQTDCQTDCQTDYQTDCH